MAQTATMLVDGEDNGPIYTNKLNAILQAVHTDFTGSVAPSNPVADMKWRDTSTTPPTMRRRNATNTGWSVDTAGAVNSVNGRIGQVTIQTSDVFATLPTKTGNAFKYLRLNASETGLEWQPPITTNWVQVATGSTPNNTLTLDVKSTYGVGLYLITTWGSYIAGTVNKLVQIPGTPFAGAFVGYYPVKPEEESSPASITHVAENGFLIGEAGQQAFYTIWKAL